MEQEQTNSMTLVCERTKPIERTPLDGEVSAKFCGYRGVAWLAQRIPTAVFSAFYTEPATFLSK
jgi:hypothetical protein